VDTGGCGNFSFERIEVWTERCYLVRIERGVDQFTLELTNVGW